MDGEVEDPDLVGLHEDKRCVQPVARMCRTWSLIGSTLESGALSNLTRIEHYQR